MHSLFSLRRISRACLVAGLLGAGPAGPIGVGSAAAEEVWPVSGKLLGKPKKSDPTEIKKAENVSGIACDRNGPPLWLCVVVDDETQGVQVVILKEGELVAGDFVGLIKDTFGNQPLELDAEAVAFSEGSFYVTGSQGRPRNQEPDDPPAKIDARLKAASHLFRITFAPNSVDLQNGTISQQPSIVESRPLAEVFAANAALVEAMSRRVKDNGLTVEGLAVTEGMVYVGLRGPVLDGDRAVVVSVPISVLFGNETTPPTFTKLPLGSDSTRNPRGIRDITAYNDGLLILAGPSQDPDPEREVIVRDYSIFYRPAGARLDTMTDLKPFPGKGKPEAILPLEERDGKLRLLLLFDGPQEGDPTPIWLE